LTTVAAACHQFRPWFLGLLSDPERERRCRAILSAAGAPADGTWEEISAWLEAHTPTTPSYVALCAVLDSLLDRPDDHAAIRAGLARLAPHIGRCATDPPLTILSAIRARFAGD
jgi:hypothetical protein